MEPEDGEFGQDDPALRAGLRGSTCRLGTRTKAAGEEHARLPGEEGPVKRCPGESKWRVQTRRNSPRSRPRTPAYLRSQMAMAGADPFAIMKAMGHTDIKTTMIYVSLGKSHIREQVERLNRVYTATTGR